jgi:hypothetical protein
MPDRDIQGVLSIGPTEGPMLPPGADLLVDGQSLFQLFRLYEGRRVRVTLSILDESIVSRRTGPRTIKDIGNPRG